MSGLIFKDYIATASFDDELASLALADFRAENRRLPQAKTYEALLRWTKAHPDRKNDYLFNEDGICAVWEGYRKERQEQAIRDWMALKK